MEARLAFAGGGKHSPYKKRCYQYSWEDGVPAVAISADDRQDSFVLALQEFFGGMAQARGYTPVIPSRSERGRRCLQFSKDARLMPSKLGVDRSHGNKFGDVG